MKILFPTILVGLFSILFYFTSPVTAEECWWYQPNCNNGSLDKICKDGSCTIQEGAKVVDYATEGLFSKKKISAFVTDTVKYFLSFVSLIAVVYFLYAGFQLMTSGGDEEKAKKTRKIMSYTIVGIILMWASYWLVMIIINSFN